MKRTKKANGIQVVAFCVDYKNQLKKNNKHHWKCDKCWEKFQRKKGNLALIGGI